MKLSTLAISILLLLLLFSVSCDESITIPETIDGVNLRIEFTEGKSFFDFEDLTNTELEYSIFTENVDIRFIEIGLSLINKDSIRTSRIVFETFTLNDFEDGSLVRTVKFIEMARKVGFFSLKGYQGGEVLDFDVVVTLNDGRVFPQIVAQSIDARNTNSNVSPTIKQSNTASFTQNFSSFVGCSDSRIVGGTYIGNATSPCLDTNYDGGIPLVEDQEVTIIQTGHKTWRISDVTLEFFSIFSDQYVDYTNQPIEFFEVCNELRFFDNKESNLSVTAFGSHDPITHQINLEWAYNNYLYVFCENTYILKQ